MGGLSENGDYARLLVLRCSIQGVLRKRNTEFFSLEYCAPVAIIRDAMAGNKTDTYGHIQKSCLKAQLGSESTTFTWGSNESAQQ